MFDVHTCTCIVLAYTIFWYVNYEGFLSHLCILSQVGRFVAALSIFFYPSVSVLRGTLAIYEDRRRQMTLYVCFEVKPWHHVDSQKNSREKWRKCISVTYVYI